MKQTKIKESTVMSDVFSGYSAIVAFNSDGGPVDDIGDDTYLELMKTIKVSNIKSVNGTWFSLIIALKKSPANFPEVVGMELYYGEGEAADALMDEQHGTFTGFLPGGKGGNHV